MFESTIALPEGDPVAAALEALVEAALASDEKFSPEMLAGMVRSRALEEAGGLVSWLKRAYTGMDSDLIAELRDDLDKRVKTAKDKADILADIDKFIAEGKGLQTSQALYHLLPPSTTIGVAATFIIRNSNTKDGSRAKYVEALKKVREEVVKKKVGD